jgi:hypothetical protein
MARGRSLPDPAPYPGGELDVGAGVVLVEVLVAVVGGGVVRVPVVPLSGVVFGDAWACAGTTTDSTIGLIHLDGRAMVTVRPAAVKIWRTRRREISLLLMGSPSTVATTCS